MNLEPKTNKNEGRHLQDTAMEALPEVNFESELNAILASYDDADEQYVKDVLSGLHEEIQLISDSDSDDSRDEPLTEYENRTVEDVKNKDIVRNPFAEPKHHNGHYKQSKIKEDICKEADCELGRYDAAAAESPKSTSSQSPDKGDSTDSTSDISELLQMRDGSSPLPADMFTDGEMDTVEDESNDYYHSMPISVGPLPSMPLYDMDFNLVQVEEPLIAPEDIKQERIDEEICDEESGLRPIKEEPHSDRESDSNCSLADPVQNDDGHREFPDVIPVGNRKFRYWKETAQRPIDKGEITQEEYLAILKEEENQKKNEKLSSGENRSEESDIEESNREDAKVRNGLDFYEDSVLFQVGSMASSSLLVVKEDSVFLEYEMCVKQLQSLIKSAPSFHKYEIYLLLYPLIAITYLQMMASDNFSRARVFLNRYVNQLDDSFTTRMGKLLNICRPADVPHRARKLLAGFEKLEMHMSGGAYSQFLDHMENWPRSQQNKVLIHFLVRRYSEKDDPKQRFAPGQPLLEPIFWGAPEPLHKKDYTTRPLLRARRRKKNESLPDRNVHLPPGDRIYTPTPKRMDLLHRKTDEQYRMKLDRNTLPSSYLYTAPACDDVVTCATFSEGISMLAVGTLSSSIHIFSLKPSKLVQLKSAHWLKALDTGMAGIDKGMLDPTKKFSRRTLHGHQGPVYRLSFNPEDRFLLSCSEDCSVRLWCLMSWNCVVIYPGHLSPVCCVTYAPMGYYFATASDDCTARIWVQDNKRPTRILKGHLAELEVCLFHPNRHYLATGSADSTVRLWDILKGAQVRLFSGHRGRITALSFSLCGRHLVSGGDDNLIMIWDLASERLIRFLSHHKASINTIQFCLDNNLLVVGGQDCQLTIWDFKKVLQDSKSTCRTQQGGLKSPDNSQSQDFLIRSFYSKDAPFYTIRFTRRNLLLAFCVAFREPQGDIEKSKDRRLSEDRRREDLGEWFEFLDLIKTKAILSG